MEDDGSTMSWQDELASIVETTGIQQYPPPNLDNDNLGFKRFEEDTIDDEEEESFKDQIKGFLKACAEISHELAKGCKDVLHQTLISHQDSYLITKLKAPCAKLTFFNDFFLPEDRHPLHAWPVVFLVFIIAISVLCVNTESQTQHKKVNTHPPTATFVNLPDGRRIAYHQRGTLAKTARFSLLSPHSFLSSRLAGIPGIKDSLLEEFGVHLITYDLPGFGESDPHPNRNLNTSAIDMLHMVDALGVSNKFWVAGYSGGAMHAWAALRYIPDRLAGAAMFAPIVNPYDPSMTKEERYGIWEKWTRRRKIMFFLALRFPSLLSLFYRRTFLSGEHGQLGKWLSLSLGEKDISLVEEATFQEFWERDVEESIRQGNVKPFIEEANLQVSRWGFSLGDIQVQKRRQEKGILSWLKSMYSQVEVEWAGFLGPIHIWQGMDDEVVTARTAEFIGRQIPGATVHKLPGEGHFSYFCFCDECHRQIFSTLFGMPQGPLNNTISSTIEEEDETSNITMATASGGREEDS
ncbi:hypothetical protein ACHQM5_009965 [Ranunculus cassubicifolius]